MIELPLSPAQERLWFLDRFDPGQPNNVTYASRLRGSVDADLLARAFAAVTLRHEALRATIVDRAGVPVQVIADPGPFDLERVDLTGEPESLRENRAREIGRQVFDTSFDLARGPLIRVVLLTVGRDDHVLLVVVHHVIFDGSSAAILMADLRTAYGALLDGNPVELPVSAVGWADYVREQADQPAGKVERDLAYWRERLAGAPVLALPTDLPRPLFKTSRTAQVRHQLDGDLTARLQRLAQTQRCTLFMVLLAGYQVLLGRHAGQEDVCVGTASAGRSRADLEGLVGCLVQTLVLRGDLSGDPTVRDLLRRTRDTALDAYGHQEVLFERLVGELDVARDVSRTPLFETMFVLHTQGQPGLDVLPGIQGAPFTVGVVQTLFDLVVDAWMTPNGLAMTARYDTALFTPETVSAMLRRFEVLLRGCVEDVDRRVSELPLDDVVGVRSVLSRGQGPRRPYAGTVASLFAARVEAAPDAVAVGSWSYRELDERANRIARYLNRSGVVPGSIVGVCLDRTPDVLATLLAVWRCGAAYLPLDPGLPSARMSWLLSDSGAGFVVTQSGVGAQLGDGGPGRLLWLDRDGTTIDRESPDPYGESTDSGALAYVLYTSGSTGWPKGVGVGHSALTNLLLSMRDALGSGPSDVWLGSTSLSFDISGLELFLPLVVGGRLVLVSEERVKDGAAIVRLVRDEGVSHVQATPSGWRMLLDAGFDFPSVVGLSGGEELPVGLGRELRSRVSRLVNVYGPTETTIWSTLAEIPAGVGAVTLGAPVGNTQVYVVDRGLRPVPVGVPGELLIGGSGVAWGYLGQPALTAGRFVPDPFGAPGGRLYRTGDRVRWLRGGGLEFLGRVDHQVKVRGYRIELGEIEARLLEHPEVGQAAVVVTGKGEDARLVGYVTAAGIEAPTGRQLRSYLAEVLPGYMVPGHVLVLETMPLNTAGKIDRRNLPTDVLDIDTREHVPPATEVEELVATTWGEVLGRDRIGALDDFFDLGGHSLLATRAVARLGAALDLEIPIRTLFVHSTVEAFAAALEELLVTDLEQLSDDEVVRLLDKDVNS
ncbi:amino acid adenylation domain-containing protein [Micromonospora sp. NBC_01699]|uniref:non-ribosomal peptide synthetase n=1 Tax=Micromonospora sp. NBC_01699 TaxID=2975984 RepID=UPI002E362847|nr:amino acid adenylation domain-containing protein [Micromonospora sp. NBC_01699]